MGFSNIKSYSPGISSSSSQVSGVLQMQACTNCPGTQNLLGFLNPYTVVWDVEIIQNVRWVIFLKDFVNIQETL